MGGARENWHLIETLPLAVSGSTSTHREATILSLVSRRQSTGARSLDDDDLNLIAGSEDEDDTIDKPADDVRIRVRLCLRSSQTTCGDYTEAESKWYICTKRYRPTPSIRKWYGGKISRLRFGRVVSRTTWSC